MTKEEKNKYLKNPDKCPYCDSDDISGEDGNFESDKATRIVNCNEGGCKQRWIEIFSLKKVYSI